LLLVSSVAWNAHSLTALPPFQICRVHGVRIRAGIGAPIVFGLVAWSLGAAYSPGTTPALSALGSWTSAVVGAMLLCSSLLAHELAHAITARQHGLEVGSVTLHLLGGVSDLRSEPPTPGIEARIAVAGPLVSFLIAAACAALHAALSGPEWVLVALRYLGAGNLLLGAFNLLPAFPLDGGRLLRAALWAWDGRVERATGLAVSVSGGIAVALIVLGGIQVISGGVLAGVWLALVGAFVLEAARATARRSGLVSAGGMARPRTATTVRATGADGREHGQEAGDRPHGFERAA
jgi:Zn-dependent protease